MDLESVKSYNLFLNRYIIFTNAQKCVVYLYAKVIFLVKLSVFVH